MRWPFVPRARHEAALAEINRLHHRVVATEKRHDEAEGERRRLADRLNEYGNRRTVSDVLEEHDVHRKALAEAIHAGLHLNWDQLIDTARQTYEAASEWRADYETEKQRADRLSSHLDDGDLKAIKQWEKRVEKHDAWKPPTGPDALEKRPIDGASARPLHPAVELRRAQEQCRLLQARLDSYGKRVAS